MDRKTCIWLKRSPVKSVVVNNEAQMFVKGDEEKVASHYCECNTKDRIMAENALAAQDAHTGRRRDEALVATKKKVPEDVLQQKVRLVHLIDAFQNSKEEIKELESKYTYARKKLANLTVENARLTKTLNKKKKIIRSISNQMSEAKEEFNVLISRLDSTERGNNVLKYEYHLLEKELHMKSRHADAANRQELEAERQKLRLLVNKRIPGPGRNHLKVEDSRMSLMIKQLCEVEKENKILREHAFKRENEFRLLKAELARMKCDEKNNGNLGLPSVEVHSLNNTDIDMEAKLLESEKNFVSLKTELEFMKESNRTSEDHFDNVENLKLVNVDLEQQLSAAKLEIKEALRKVCFLEMELEERSHHFEGLEAACLELQLQLASVSSKDDVTEDPEHKLHQTGLEITTELRNNKKLTPHLSLRDQMAAEDGIDIKDLLNSPMIKESINTTETKEPLSHVTE
ncbi:restin [Tanacetum coccineum]